MIKFALEETLFPEKNISNNLAYNCYVSVFSVTVACRVKSLNRCRIEQALLKGTEKKKNY